MEAWWPSDSGVTVVAKRDGVVESVDAARIVVKVPTRTTTRTSSNVDIINLIKYHALEPEHLHQPAPIVSKPGDGIGS